MKKLIEATTTGSTTSGGYNKLLTDKPIKRTETNASSSNCICKTLPGKVSCGLCKTSKRK